MALRYKEFKFFSDSDNLEIDCMSVAPEGKIKGVVQIVHGMCEHKERYYDGGYNALIDDIHQLTEIVKDDIGCDVPYILIGHSMGSLAVRCYLKKYDNDIDKLVVVGSPSKPFGVSLGLGLANVLEKIKGGKAHSKVLDYIVFNSRNEKKYKSEGVRHSWICSDRNVVEIYNNDRYCNYSFTIDGYIQLLNLMNETYGQDGWQLNNPKLPIMFMSGRDDVCNISPRHFGKSVHFIKKIGYENVEARLYGGMRYEILNEKRKKRVYRDIYIILFQIISSMNCR